MSARSQALPPASAVVAGIAASTALRWRTLRVPLTSDEGGFLAIARAWSHGATLYRDVWADRPQGMIVLYRICRLLGGDGAAGVRAMAMVAAAVIVAATAVVAASLAGRGAGAFAAILVGVLVSCPAIEGHIANGELLSSAFTVSALGVACRALTGSRATGSFVLAGGLTGAGLMVKQSGFDTWLAFLACVAVGIGAKRWSWREAGRWAGWMAAGVAGVIVLGVLHGLVTGIGRWWFAVIGYRFDSRSAVTGSNWSHLRTTAPVAARILGPLAVAAALLVLVDVAAPHVRARWAGSPRRFGGVQPGPLTPLLVLWPAASALAFVAGGLFHLHYWVLLCPSVAAVGGAVIASRADARTGAMAVAVALILPLASSVDILRHTLDEIPSLASADNRGPVDESVAAWYHANAAPGERLFVMCASAGFYGTAGEDPPYPYLWLDNILDVPGAVQRLRALLASPAGPAYIAVYQPPRECDPSGALGNVVDSHYHSFDRVGPVEILAHDPP